MSMSLRKYGYFAASIVLVVVVALVGFLTWKTKHVTPSSNTPDALQKQWSQALASGNPAACDTLTDASLRTQCQTSLITNRALKENDFALCQDVKLDKNARQDCLGAVVSQRALNQGIQTCDVADNYSAREQCRTTWLNTVPVREKNIKLCDVETDSVKQKACMDNFAVQTSTKH